MKRRLVLVLAFVLAVVLLAVALWPAPESPSISVSPLVKKGQAHTYPPPSHWYDRLVARSLSELPLYGEMLGFETVDAVGVGQVALVELEIPLHPDPARIWAAMLADGSSMVHAIMDWYPELEGVYVWCGIELASSDCTDGCSHHLYPAFQTYVARSQIAITWPFPGAILINPNSWWDRQIFHFK